MTAGRSNRNPWAGFFGAFTGLGVVSIYFGVTRDHPNQTWVGVVALVVAIVFGVCAFRRQRARRLGNQQID